MGDKVNALCLFAGVFAGLCFEVLSLVAFLSAVDAVRRHKYVDGALCCVVFLFAVTLVAIDILACVWYAGLC